MWPFCKFTVKVNNQAPTITIIHFVQVILSWVYFALDFIIALQSVI